MFLTPIFFDTKFFFDPKFFFDTQFFFNPIILFGQKYFQLNKFFQPQFFSLQLFQFESALTELGTTQSQLVYIFPNWLGGGSSGGICEGWKNLPSFFSFWSSKKQRSYIHRPRKNMRSLSIKNYWQTGTRSLSIRNYWQGQSLSIRNYWQEPSLSMRNYWQGQSLSITSS